MNYASTVLASVEIAEIFQGGFNNKLTRTKSCKLRPCDSLRLPSFLPSTTVFSSVMKRRLAPHFKGQHIAPYCPGVGVTFDSIWACDKCMSINNSANSIGSMKRTWYGQNSETEGLLRRNWYLSSPLKEGHLPPSWKEALISIISKEGKLQTNISSQCGLQDIYIYYSTKIWEMYK